MLRNKRRQTGQTNLACYPTGLDDFGFVMGYLENVSQQNCIQYWYMKLDCVGLVWLGKSFINVSVSYHQEVLLSDSSDSSSDEDDEAPLTEEDLQEMLWLHKQQKLAQQMFHVDKDVSSFSLQ